MTRINLISVAELCDQHLLAEHRELTRIPNAVVAGRYSMKGQPSEYVLGKGHVKFFYDKLQFLFRRYRLLQEECELRGFNVKNRWNHAKLLSTHGEFLDILWNDYDPTPEAIALSRARIEEKMKNFKPRFYGEYEEW